MAMSAKAKKVIKIVVNVLLWLFLAFALFTTIMALAAQGDESGEPSLFGNYMLTVESDSMSPTFKQGDIILCTKLSNAEKENLKEGDVITYRFTKDGKPALNTHRIVQVLRDSNGKVSQFVTKGDNKETNTLIDDFSPSASAVIARWDGTKLNGLGNVLIFLQSSTGFLVCIVIPMILFFLYEVYRFIRTLLAVKNEGKKVITAEDEALIKQKAVEEYLRQQAEQKAQSTTDTPSETPPEDGENK